MKCFHIRSTTISILLLFANGLLAQSHDDHRDEGRDDDEVTIHFSDSQIRDFEITLEEVGSVQLATETILPGEVKLNQENMAHVSPRYDSIVTNISARLGDKVRAGQILATLESNETLAPFSISAPIDGTIVTLHITLGESVASGSYLFVVADLETLWVDLDIFQKDIGLVKKGQRVLIQAGRNIPSAQGLIDYVGPVVDEATRTGLARVSLPNPNGTWKAGMFVSGHVNTDTSLVPIAVKRSALQTLNGQIVIFVKTEKGFESRPVILGKQDSQFAEVLSGVEIGEQYAAAKSFIVKAQKQKASIDPHAGHNH